MTDHLIAPHGGTLVNALVDEQQATEFKAASRDWPSWDLTERQLCDLELLLNGGFSPLTGFMTKAEYDGVVADMRLPDGSLWPLPITLDVPQELAKRLKAGGHLALRDPEGVMLACLQVEDVWVPDRGREAEAVFGTMNSEHPGVNHLLTRTQTTYVGGRLAGLQLPVHYDFRLLRLTPGEVREHFAKLGWRRVVAFQTRTPMHRAHQELTLRVAKELEASLLIHPLVGVMQPGDVDHYTRVRCYQALMPSYPKYTALLALLPLVTRGAGLREALWHAIISQNHGCTHLIVGGDHAAVAADSTGEPFAGLDPAQALLRKHEPELDIAMVPFRQMVYVPERGAYYLEDEVPAGAETVHLCATEQRRRLQAGIELPSWFTFPSVEAELRRSFPPRHRQGFTVFFTGLSGSGKSTVANVLRVKFLEVGGRPVTLLDGDIVRKHLSSELGFSKEHRDLNIRRIGFVASEITKNGGIAICAPIAPYEAVRREVRQMIEPYGGWVLVYLATPIEVCEARDRKGLYAKARAGLIQGFTGVSDPYEEPANAELTIDTTDITPEEVAHRIILLLEKADYIAGNAG